MIDIPQQLAVQSYCYRGFKDNEQFIEKVKETGLSRVEICKVHVDFTDESAFDDVVALYADRGIEIVSIGVQRLTDDEAAERKYFEFCRKAGARMISVDFSPDSVPGSYRTAEKLADEYDVRLAIHNHGGRHWLGSKQMLAHVFANTSDRIGLCLDTAWAMHSHEDPIALAEQFAEQFGKRLYAVHIKDFIFDRAGQHQDVVVGTGNLDLAKFNETLKAIDFNGLAILEYEGDVDNPVPALQECVEAIRADMAS